MAHTQPTHCRFAMSKAGFQRVAPSPEGQRLGSRKALSLGGSRERSGRGEFFTRSRMIGTTFLNLSNADAASKSQKPHFTSRQSCGGYRVKKLGASPSSRPPPPPRRCLAAASPLPLPSAALPLPLCCLLAGPLRWAAADCCSFAVFSLDFPATTSCALPPPSSPASSASPSRGIFFHFPPCGGTEFLL